MGHISGQEAKASPCCRVSPAEYLWRHFHARVTATSFSSGDKESVPLLWIYSEILDFKTPNVIPSFQCCLSWWSESLPADSCHCLKGNPLDLGTLKLPTVVPKHLISLFCGVQRCRKLKEESEDRRKAVTVRSKARDVNSQIFQNTDGGQSLPCYIPDLH